MALPKCKSGTMITTEHRLSAEHNIKQCSDLLRKPTFTEVALYIKEIKNNKIVVISGPRISLPLGIPDFRSPDVGLFHAPFEDECYYCDALSKEYFMKEPAPLYKLTSLILERDCRPSYSHYFIAFLEHKNLLLKNFTENTDDLEKLAGVTRYTQIYGSFYSFVCIKCKQEYSLEWAKARLGRKKILLCTKCASLIKPNIFLYGDELPPYDYEDFEAYMNESTLLIFLGTTLSNEHLATVLRGIDFKFPRLFINDVDPYDFSDFHFYCEHEHNDVIMLGNVDSTCKKLVKLLGWSKELQEFAKLDVKESEEHGTSV